MTVSRALRKAGVRSTHFYAASLGSIGLCISLWIRAKTVDQDERGNAERRALFVGLWPSMFWLMGDSLKDAELVREQLLGRVDESAALDELPGSRSTTVRRGLPKPGPRSWRETGTSTPPPR